MDKSELHRLIVSKSDRISFSANDGKSDIWPHFLKVNVDSLYCSHVMCKYCKTVLKWKAKDGTSGLKSHFQSCKSKPGGVGRKITDVTVLQSSPGGHATASRQLSTAERNELTETVVRFCAKDIRPFSTVEGRGFMELAGKLISIGAKYGNLSPTDVLPSARTVSRHIVDVVSSEKTALATELSSVSKFAVTTDMWTHECTNTPYITVTVHYITDWKLSSRILATRELDEKHTAVNISTAVREILDEVGAWKQDNTYVTDNGANVKAAFKDQSWLGCAGHNLNLVLVHGLKCVNDNDDLMSEVTQLIQVCKSVVSHVKKSRIQSKLETTLKQSVSTRWNSILTMLKSIARNTDALKMLADEFTDRKLQRLLLDINNDLLTEIISVLEPFDAATRMLSTDRTVSIHLVAATKWQLQKHLQAKVGDSAVTGHLKSQLSCMVDQYFTRQASTSYCCSARPAFEGKCTEHS